MPCNQGFKECRLQFNVPPMSQQRKILLIGTGAISNSHMKAIERHFEGAEVHGFDVSADTRKAFGEKYAQAQMHESLEDLLGIPASEKDIAIIATPPFAHEEPAIAALQSGRATLVEKPFAMDDASAGRILAAAKAAGRPVACCSNRFTGWKSFAKARELVHSGQLGTLTRVNWQSRWFKGRSAIDNKSTAPWYLLKEKAGGGILMDWGSYDFAALNSLLSPVEVTIRAAWTAQTPTTEDFVKDLAFDVENQALAWMEYTLEDGKRLPVLFERANHVHDPHHGPRSSRHRVEGTRGAFSWDWFPGNRVDLDLENGGEYKTEEFAYEEPFDTVMDQPLLSLARALGGEKDHYACLDTDAVFNFACIQGLYKAAESDQPVTLKKGYFA